eukprot:11226503-Lingulodinium_polyedra.AAC.1
MMNSSPRSSLSTPTNARAPSSFRLVKLLLVSTFATGTPAAFVTKSVIVCLCATAASACCGDEH